MQPWSTSTYACRRTSFHNKVPAGPARAPGPAPASPSHLSKDHRGRPRLHHDTKRRAVRRRVAAIRNVRDGSRRTIDVDSDASSDARASTKQATRGSGRRGRTFDAQCDRREEPGLAHLRRIRVRDDVASRVRGNRSHHRQPPERAGCALGRRHGVGAPLQALQEQQNRAEVHEQVRGHLRAWRWWSAWSGTDERAKGTGRVRRRLSNSWLLHPGMHGDMCLASRPQRQAVGRPAPNNMAVGWHEEERKPLGTTGCRPR
eukprot:scaffold285_cov330-Pavlova_lutheri.AAC.28